jgi:parallel beta-helix repeat protein
MRACLCFSVALLALAVFGGPGFAADATVPGDFASIGAAIAGATDQDSDGVIEIAVAAGTYNENLFISRSSIHLVGDDRETTILQGNGIAPTILVHQAADFGLTGFTVRGSATARAVYIERGSACAIASNIFEGSRKGLVLNRTTTSRVEDNIARNNFGTGIRLDRSDNNDVLGNTCTGNLSQGIDVRGGTGNLLDGNTCNSNNDSGLRVRGATATTVQGNTANGNRDNGLRMRQVLGCSFVSNVCSNNGDSGLRMRETSGNSFFGNTLTGNNEYGVRRRDWSGDDWDSTIGGVQDLPGDNDLSGNNKGPVRND